MICNAAIESANILDASVQTLKIAGQAVTVPVGVSLGSPYSYPQTGPITTWETILSCAVSNSGAPSLILGAMAASGMTNASVQFRILRDGAVLWTQNGISGSFGVPATASAFYLDNPGAGSHTYSVQISSNAVGSVTAAEIISMELKR